MNNSDVLDAAAEILRTCCSQHIDEHNKEPSSGFKAMENFTLFGTPNSTSKLAPVHNLFKRLFRPRSVDKAQPALNTKDWDKAQVRNVRAGAHNVL